MRESPSPPHFTLSTVTRLQWHFFQVSQWVTQCCCSSGGTARNPISVKCNMAPLTVFSLWSLWRNAGELTPCCKRTDKEWRFGQWWLQRLHVLWEMTEQLKKHMEGHCAFQGITESRTAASQWGRGLKTSAEWRSDFKELLNSGRNFFLYHQPL